MSTVNLENKTILVTGAAGFIGSNLVKRIYEEVPSATVIGIDNMNVYYDVALKEFRLNELAKYPTFTFVKGNIADKELITDLFEKYKPAVVVNLAAQAGVRYSITNPDAYVESNLVGFFNILEACRHSYDDGQTGVEHLVYASSSSVYGSNKKVPYSTDDKVDNPVSLYAATKKSNELMAHAYSKLYNIPSTGLRFFTVYGPAGRPDMAYFGFTNKLVKGETIQLKADLSLKDIGNMINKVVQGWINYYTHYYKSEFYEVLRYINQCLIKWVRRSYKKKNTRSRAEHWLGAVARRDRNLFAHWKFGILPSVGEGAV